MKKLCTALYFLILVSVQISCLSNLKKAGIYEKDDVEFFSNFMLTQPISMINTLKFMLTERYYVQIKNLHHLL